MSKRFKKNLPPPSQLTLRYNLADDKSSWDMIPDSLWKRIVSDFVDTGCCLGFQYLNSMADIKSFGFFDNLEFQTNGTFIYKPYCSVNGGDEEVVLFKLSSELLEELSSIILISMFPYDDELPTDEIIIVRDDKLILTASNVDSHITFYNLTDEMRNKLYSYGPEVLRGLE